MIMWYERRGDDWHLCNEKGGAEKVGKLKAYKRSNAFAEEWNKARVFMKAIGHDDGMAFGANMSALICDAVAEIDGQLKLLVFSTVNAAERSLFPMENRNFKRKCMRRVEEFYSKKEYQLRIQFQEEDNYNDHILRPIILQVSTEGILECVPTHKRLSKMKIIPLEHYFEAIWRKEDGRFQVDWAVRKYKEQQHIK